MTNYPKDPAMLMSWTNLKLRDFYGTLDDLCDELEIDRNEIEKILNEAGFEYNQELNRFW
ncbi:MAG: DUF4250 domain-containing protein [Bacteroidales bacterium]|nr:DUF4250 domain-containing protein [Bacteroidales bacterium]MBQ6709917.1 DUF4250 domain-containing protein [Bacteroidales bacterium]MBQ8049648.1 DUF4250 domain-containing protein [Bacteroidales bacterium]